MNKKKKTALWIAAMFLTVLVTYTCLYKYDKEKAVNHITTHHLEKSHSCCAWYVMRAMQEGGCPIGILPAWAYKYALPLYGFEEIPKDGYVPQIGDIVVFAAVGKHIWGHIAMYDGAVWISDFKQKSMYVYSQHNGYALFRIKATREAN